MKLSELRPCDNCGGVLHRGGVFHVVRHSIALIDSRKANQVLGMTQFFRGHLGLAEAMTGDGDVVTVAMDRERSMGSEIFLCPECYLASGVAELVEKADGRREADDDETP